MVLNEGDATTSSKEALINLLNMKIQCADRKTKVLDLMMRCHLKEKDAFFPKYLAQHNEIKIEDNSKKRRLLQSIINEKEIKQ